MLSTALTLVRSKGARLVSALIAAMMLLAGVYAFHVSEKNAAIKNARIGWVQELDLMVANNKLNIVTERLQTERLASQNMDQARQTAEERLAAYEMELLADEYDMPTDGCVVSDDLFDQLR